MTKSSVTKRGQTVIPASIRKKYHIVEGTRLEWIDTGEGIRVVPIPKDVLGSLKGVAKGEKLVERLLREREEDEKK